MAPQPLSNPGCIRSQIVPPATSSVNQDVSVHAYIRKLWAHGFSARALISHEELEQRYVSLFIEQIRRHGVASKDGMNMVEWFNFLTFDIIGELVFGEGFGA